MTDANRTFPGAASDLVVNCSVIVASARTYQHELLEADDLFDDTYFTHLDDLVQKALNYLGASNVKELLERTASLKQLQAEAIGNLQFVRTQLEVRYAKDPQRFNFLMTILGFKTYYHRAMQKNQQALSSLLESFKKNMTPDLEAELVDKKIKKERLYNIMDAAAPLLALNVAQEGAKGSKKDQVASGNEHFGMLYARSSASAKSARRYLKIVLPFASSLYIPK